MGDRSGVGLTWIGQAGYAIEAPRGELCLLDPYLSEFALEELGLPRVAPIPLNPETTRADVVAITHTRHDHLDLIACAALARANPEVIFTGPSSIVARLVGRGIAPERIVCIERGETVEIGPFTFHGHYARHEVRGWLTEDALAYVVEVAGTRILHSGDTEYDMRCLAVGERAPFDVGLSEEVCVVGVTESTVLMSAGAEREARRASVQRRPTWLVGKDPDEYQQTGRQVRR